MSESFLSRWTKVINAIPREHKWKPTDRAFRRQCSRCGEVDLLLENKYPQIGGAKYNWQKEDTKCTSPGKGTET